jgi:hypothetical protein
MSPERLSRLLRDYALRVDRPRVTLVKLKCLERAVEGEAREREVVPMRPGATITAIADAAKRRVRRGRRPKYAHC